MRLYLILGSMLVLAAAKPQYNYGSGISGSFGGSNGFFGNVGGLASSTGGLFGGGSLKFQNGIGGGSSFGSGSFLSSVPIGGGQQHPSNFNQYPQQQQTQTSAQFEAPLVHKQFITVAAPEDNESLERTKHLVIGRPQKNYRVVFIKAPSSSNANVKLSAEYAPQEEKTVIYVLSKKDSSLEVGDIATPAPSVPSKPEVFFIKYKTEEEAQHAQKHIQAEYDKIEGTSEHTDAGVAPQQSVIGILGGIGSTSSFGTGTAAGNSGAATGIPNSILGGSTFSSVGSTSNNAAKPSAYLPPAGH